MQISRKIYYELSTGNVIQEIGEREGSVVETTLDQDFESYASLTERVKSTVGVIQLTYGQYADKFGVYYYNIVSGAIVWGELIVPPPPEKTEIEKLKDQLMDSQQNTLLLNDTISGFVDYMFSSIPDLQ